MKFARDEEAVSPVIGVILMVAITVILAAVIATFVFGMAGDIQSTKTVALTATQNSSGYAFITVHGGADIGELEDLAVNNKSHTYIFQNPGVGDVIDSNITVGGEYGNLRVVGNFTDGSQQLLLDKTF